MKKLKKIASLLLALVMVMALVVPAMAATAPGDGDAAANQGGPKEVTLGVSDANPTGHTFRYYQIFKADVSADGSGLEPDTVVWGSGINAQAFVDALKSSSEDWTYGSLFAGVTVDAEAPDASAQEVAQIIASKFYPYDDGPAAKALAALIEANMATVLVGAGTGLPANKVASGYYVLVDTQTTGTGEDAVTTETVRLQQVLGKDITIAVKSESVAMEKKVKDSEDGQWHDAAVYAVGDTVEFKLTMTVPDNFLSSDKFAEHNPDGSVVTENGNIVYQAYPITFHDSMSAGLTFDKDSVKVFYQGDENGTPLVADRNWYTVVEASEENPLTHKNTEDPDCTFEVRITDLRKLSENTANAVKPGDVITVTYTATVNENVALGDAVGNPNTAWVETPDNETPKDKVKVFTFEFEVNKVDGNSEPLEGAAFSLYRWISQEEFNALVQEKIAAGVTDEAAARQAVAEELGLQIMAAEEDEIDNMAIGPAVVTNDGVPGYWALVGSQDSTQWADGVDKTKFTFTGLKDGWYKLVEDKAPNVNGVQYNKAADSYFVINSTTTEGADPLVEKLEAKWTEETGSSKIIEGQTEGLTANKTMGQVSTDVVNRSGMTLPSTGGIGTTIFYVGGGLLVVAAGILLVVRKRMGGD